MIGILRIIFRLRLVLLGILLDCRLVNWVGVGVLVLMLFIVGFFGLWECVGGCLGGGWW